MVDIWAGHADAQRSRPWQEDTIVNVYSTTKTMAALCLLMFADRDQIDLAAPVSRYWPEFGQNGKDRGEGQPVLEPLGRVAGVRFTRERRPAVRLGLLRRHARASVSAMGAGQAQRLAGGSTIVVDFDKHLCFSYVINQMTANIIGDSGGGSLG